MRGEGRGARGEGRGARGEGRGARGERPGARGEGRFIRGRNILTCVESEPPNFQSINLGLGSVYGQIKVSLGLV